MAGVAMGLGTDDLADVGEAATLATNKMGMEQGQQSTIIHDPKNGKTRVYNNGDDRVMINDGRGTNFVVQRGGANAMYPMTNGRPGKHGQSDAYNMTPRDRHLHFEHLNRLR